MGNRFAYLLLFSFSWALGQPVQIGWELKDGGRGEEKFVKAIQLSSGQIAILGNSTSSEGGKRSGTIHFLDFSTGKVMAKFAYGNPHEVTASDLLELPNGDLLLFGTSTYNRIDYPWIYRLDSRGNKVFEKTLPLAEGTSILAVTKGPDNQLILAAVSRTGSFYVLHLTEDLATVWQKEFNAPALGELRKLCTDWKGNIILGGNTRKGEGQSVGDVWVMSLDRNGNENWRKFFGGKLWDTMSDLVTLPDGSVLFLGETNSIGMGKQDFWLVRLSNGGIQQWERTYGGREEDIGLCLLPLHNGNFWLGGKSLSLLEKKGATRFAARLIEIDPGGNLQWEADYGGDNDEEILHLLQIHDGSVLFSGWTASGTQGAKDAWMVSFPAPEMNRLLAKGNLRIDESRIWLNTEDGVLKPDSKSFLSFQLTNKETNLIENIRVEVALNDGQKGLIVQQQVFAQPLAPNRVNQINVPLQALSGLETRDNSIRVAVYSGSDLIKTLNGSVKTLNPRAATLRFVQMGTSKEGVDEFSPQLLTVEIQNDGDVAASQVTANVDIPKGILPLGATSVSIGDIPPKSLRKATFRFQKTVQFIGNEVSINCTVTDNTQSRISKSVSTRFDVVSANQTANIIVFNNPRASQKRTEWNQPTFRIEAMFGTTTQNLRLGDAVIRINGVIPERSKMDEEKLVPPAAAAQGGSMNFYDYENVIALAEGENRVMIELMTPNGVIQSNEMIIQYKPRQPNLHVLSIGIPHRDLKYTTVDAENFAAAFENQSGSQKVFNKVYVEKRNTRENTRNLDIRAAMEDLRRRYNSDMVGGKINREDVLVLFLSSHGKSDANNEFKILASDHDTYGDVSNIDYKRDILDILNQIDCKKLVFIDACQSGSAQGARLLSQARFALEEINAAYPGMNVMTSSQVDELSYEDDAWGNGAFTEALLEAFSGKSLPLGSGVLQADADGDKIIRFGELFDYLQKRVPSMVMEKKKAKQMPSQMSKGLGDQIPIYVLY